MTEPKTLLTLHFPVFVTSSGATVVSQSTAKQQQPEINWVWLLLRPHRQAWKHFKEKKKSLYSTWKKLRSGRRERTGRFKGMEKKLCNLIKRKEGWEGRQRTQERQRRSEEKNRGKRSSSWLFPEEVYSVVQSTTISEVEFHCIMPQTFNIPKRWHEWRNRCGNIKEHCTKFICLIYVCYPRDYVNPGAAEHLRRELGSLAPSCLPTVESQTLNTPQGIPSSQKDKASR